MIRILPFCFFPLLLLSVGVFAQDLHYSQFYHNPLHLNPAQAYVFGADEALVLAPQRAGGR